MYGLYFCEGSALETGESSVTVINNGSEGTDSMGMVVDRSKENF